MVLTAIDHVVAKLQHGYLFLKPRRLARHTQIDQSAPLENECHFSPDRRHRYSLIHRWNPHPRGRLILWIGLNPSTADESQLDPTLTRIAAFSKREGFDGFWMANLFAARTPHPKVMMAAPDPVGPATDAELLRAAAGCEQIVAAWGVGGEFQDRGAAVARLFAGKNLWCLGQTLAGHPRHPLYVAGKQPLVRWPAPVA